MLSPMEGRFCCACGPVRTDMALGGHRDFSLRDRDIAKEVRLVFFTDPLSAISMNHERLFIKIKERTSVIIRTDDI